MKRATSKKTNKKKKFIPMRVTAVKLSPEQAVISCCDSVTKRQAAYAGTSNCYAAPSCNPGGSGTQATSS